MSAAAGQRGVSLVIPAYNEEARLPSLFAALAGSANDELGRAGLRYVETVIVDDGSTDATAALLRDAALEDPRIRPVLERPINLGKGAALKAGVEAASAEMVLLVDVDLSTPLSDAERLTGALNDSPCAMAIGSRAESPEVIAPLHRRLLGIGFNLAVRILTGLDYADTQSGFKLIETAVARDLFREQVSPRFAFDVELLMRARIAGVPVVEVPVTYVHDDRSRVRILRTSAEMAIDLIRLSRSLRRGGRRARPTLPLGGAGRG